MIIASDPSLSPTAIASARRKETRLIGLVGMAHLTSHFCQLLLPPLFPWLKDAFAVSYAQLGFLMTLFFVVSCAVQMLSGFLVDRFGPRPILFAGMACLALSAFAFAASESYVALAAVSVLAGVGNGVFHPVDYTLLNRLVSAGRLGPAYSVHGVTGSLGWALAPVLLVTLAAAFSWRIALVVAGLMVLCVLCVLFLNRSVLFAPPTLSSSRTESSKMDGGSLGFLAIPAVWMCFAFFLFSAMSLSAVQTFAPEAAGHLHAMPVEWVASCLTIYMACSAAGIVFGGILATQPERCERVIGVGFGLAALVALTLGLVSMPAWGVPVLFGLMGFCAGTGGPARDMIVKRSTPPHATGRVYGVVYSGLDIGQAVAPLFFGALMDHQHYSGVLIGLAVVQGVLIISAFRVKQVRRTAVLAA